MNTATKPLRSRGTASAGKPRDPRILLFGDSHSHAIQRAIEKRIGKGQSAPLSAHRLLKEKNGRNIGDTSFEDFLESIRRLTPGDVVLSMIGGNQHSVLSMIQHPQAFDFFAPGEAAPDSAKETIPYKALEEVFTRGLRGGDGKTLEALRQATRARVVHILPPPPKSDNAFIEQYHETLFAQEGLPTLGVSPPALRLKFWKLQARVLERICAELEIEVMRPPRRTIDEEGFLRPEYYAQDATHGNWRYGERVLRKIERKYLHPAASGEHA
jgi:hypothetical protein